MSNWLLGYVILPLSLIAIAGAATYWNLRQR